MRFGSQVLPNAFVSNGDVTQIVSEDRVEERGGNAVFVAYEAEAEEVL